MAANFPEIWVKRVIKNMEQMVGTAAAWLNGIGDVDGDVIELGAGTETEKNIIHIPISTFEPAVLVNNTTYPIAAVEYTDDNAILTLNKFQTEVTTLSDDQVMGASYNKIDLATGTHTRALTKKKFAMAIHAMAPAGNAALTPVFLTTGALVGGRRRLLYEDLVTAKDKADALGWDEMGRRMVLTSEHWNDLLLDRQYFGNLMIDYNKGGVAPEIAGWKITQNLVNPYFTGTNKKTFGVAPIAGDFRASVFFHESNVGKKQGFTKQYYLPANLNPRNQSNEINYRHYFIVMPFQNKYIGAIASATS
jgi:hypothetical protein